MNEIAKTLAHFNKTTLESLDALKLLKRYDTKFIFRRDKLMPVFEYLSDHYQILEIDGRRFFKYDNLYYDTDDFFFYRQHHNNKLDRYKVRFRKYIESNRCYFEIKHKNNKNKTIKSRLLLSGCNILFKLSEESKSFARSSISLNGNIIDRLEPKLTIGFERITFANHDLKERLTFDSSLVFTNTNLLQRRIDNLVVAELKSEKHSTNTKLVQYLKTLRIYPAAFSKYCIGIATTEKSVKYNRFKKGLLQLNHLN